MKAHISLKNIQKCLMVCSLAFGGSATALATTIEYSISNLGGTEWQYTYTVKNDSLLTDLEDVAIFFPELWPVTDPTLFTNISVAGLPQPGGWTATAFQWSAIDLGGYVDFSSGTGLAPGASLGGFNVKFNYSGSGTPGSQYFEIYDSAFNLLDDGYTVLAGIPEPASLSLFAIGLAGLFARRRLQTSNPTDSTIFQGE